MQENSSSSSNHGPYNKSFLLNIQNMTTANNNSKSYMVKNINNTNSNVPVLIDSTIGAGGGQLLHNLDANQLLLASYLNQLKFPFQAANNSNNKNFSSIGGHLVGGNNNKNNFTEDLLHSSKKNTAKMLNNNNNNRKSELIEKLIKTSPVQQQQHNKDALDLSLPNRSRQHVVAVESSVVAQAESGSSSLSPLSSISNMSESVNHIGSIYDDEYANRYVYIYCF